MTPNVPTSPETTADADDSRRQASELAGFGRESAAPGAGVRLDSGQRCVAVAFWRNRDTLRPANAAQPPAGDDCHRRLSLPRPRWPTVLNGSVALHWKSIAARGRRPESVRRPRFGLGLVLSEGHDCARVARRLDRSVARRVELDARSTAWPRARQAVRRLGQPDNRRRCLPDSERQ